MANPNTLSSAPETANPVPRELDAAAKNPDNTKLLADARQAAGQELDAGATAAEKPPYTTAEAAIGFADVTALKVRYGVTVTGNAVTIDGDRHVWLDGKPANIWSLKFDGDTRDVSARFAAGDSNTVELVVANANGSTNVIRVSDRPEAPKSDFETSLSPKNKDKLAGYGITAAGDTMTVEDKQYVWVDGQRSSQREFTFGSDVAGILPLTRGVPVLGGVAEIFVKYKDGTEKYIFVTSDKDRAPPK